MQATEVKAGMVVRVEGRACKVVEAEIKMRAGQINNLVKFRLRDLDTGRLSELHVRPEERFEELDLDRHTMEFLYSQGDTYTFMRPDTFDQIELAGEQVGPARPFLQEGMALPVEFFEGRPVSIAFPPTVELRVEQTAPAVHSQQDSTWKEATLENGVVVKVPLFVDQGEMVRVETETGRYVERVRAERKRGS